jgi:anaerobic selenocysteine-containing dehydrogenase
MTATAQRADYVVAIPLSLETAGSTSRVEALKYVGVSRGFTIPWAQYTPKVVEPPPSSDLIEDAAFFFRLAQRMDLQLTWTNAAGYRGHTESPTLSVPLDMAREPTNEALIALTCANSRVPLDEVKRHPHGKVFDEVAMKVAAADPACTARLELADPLMIEELALVRRQAPVSMAGGATHLLVSRRINRVMNSVGHHLSDEDRTPACLHPDDAAALGLSAGDDVTVRSKHAAIEARVQIDDTLRRGIVSVVHGFGGAVSAGPPSAGASVTRLVSMDEFDPISGLPRLSAIPVAIERSGIR